MSNPGTVEHLGKNYIFSECMQFSREVSWNKWAEVYEICCGLMQGREELRPYTLLSLAEPGPGPVAGEWSTTELRALAALTVSLSESLPALAALVSLPTSGIVTPASSASKQKRGRLRRLFHIATFLAQDRAILPKPDQRHATISSHW